MPAIANVVGQDREDGDLKVTVRVTGLGSVDDGGMPKRAKLRALLASGMVPDTLTGKRSENVVKDTQFEKEVAGGDNFTIRGRMPTNISQDINMSLDPEVAEGDIDDVKRALDVIKEFGAFAQLTNIREMETEGVVGLTPIKNRFGRGFVDIVNTAEYEYIITTKYSSA